VSTGLETNDLRELALAVRNEARRRRRRARRRSPAAEASAFVAAVKPAAGVQASSLIKDAARAVGGGGVWQGRRGDRGRGAILPASTRRCGSRGDAAAGARA
jgi:hypothetical protein